MMPVRTIALLIASLAAFAVQAGPELNAKRAKFNYQLFCQGCHLADGSGGRGVPNMKGFVGNFLQSQQGREYLVRVPGSANSPLDDEQLAELINWKLITFGGDSVPSQWRAYNADEVANYRAEPLFEVLSYRQELLKQLGHQ